MYIVFIVLIIIASVLLILAVLAQSPKGGMAANFGASNQVMGVRQTADFLEKFTWGLAISIVFLAVGSTMVIPAKDGAVGTKAIDEQVIENINKTVGNKPIETQNPATGGPATGGPATGGPASTPTTAPVTPPTTPAQAK